MVQSNSTTQRPRSWFDTRPGRPAVYTESEWHALRHAGIRMSWIEPVSPSSAGCGLYNVFTAHVVRPSDGRPDPRHDAVIYTGEFRECQRLCEGLLHGFIEPFGLVEVVSDPIEPVSFGRTSRGTGCDAEVGSFVEWVAGGRHMVGWVRVRSGDWLIVESPECGTVPLCESCVDVCDQPPEWPEGIDHECMDVFLAGYPDGCE